MPTLQFKGKTFVQNHHLTVKYHQLVPKEKLSLTKKVSLHDNLIINGDNLIALKALLPSYAGKIKCIYIDPPYNTGNEGWAYNDNVSSPLMKDWLGKVVDKEDLTRHDKWLCMMMPRLKLLRELLSEDGVIFISIDDNEQHRLRMLCDEVFGEDNFVVDIAWRSGDSSNNDAKTFSNDYNSTLVYSKTLEWLPNRLERTEKNNEHYKNPDNDPRGPWFAGNVSSPNPRENLKYKIKTPGRKIIAPPANGWRWKKETLMEMIDTGEIIFSEDETRIIKKTYLADQGGLAPSNIWFDIEETGHNRQAKYEQINIFPEKNTSDQFKTPKPLKFIKKILALATNKDSIVLDSFAGSATTAHAVLEMNKEDDGNRKFILVEQEDYANSVTAERVRRVINGVKNPRNEAYKKGLGGSFSYFELGDPIELYHLLEGSKLPKYKDFARFLFYTATGEQFDEKKINEKTGFIGESSHYEVYLIYKPDIDYLKKTALTLELAKSLPKFKAKQRLVFAPMKFLDEHTLREHRIDFCQLPYEIYKMAK
ncbi:MAG: site-specific DNA-methyltransferase [Bacteroidia bacterium]|nr:site-specific DNA-methyltransferase [Bacteroidia bacterium]